MTLSDADLKYEVVIRQVLEELEKLEIQRIFQRIYKDYGGAGYLDYLLNRVSQETWFILLKNQGCVVATGALYVINGHAGEIFFVAVDPEHRGQGLGRAVNQVVETYAKGIGLQLLYTYPLINFHELQGNYLRLNLGNLVNTQKQGYILTGFMLGIFVDFVKYEYCG